MPDKKSHPAYNNLVEEFGKPGEDVESFWKRNNNTSFSKESILEFMTWFNSCESFQNYQKTGTIDFYHKIFNSSDLYKLLGDPGNKNCLEIGVGGGRLLNAACKAFNGCYGIDVHSSLEKTKQILESFRNENFSLINFDDLEEKIKEHDLERSIDFIFSYTVFQHFSSWKVAKNYIELCGRLLSDNGVAKIFFGKNNISELQNCDYVERGMEETGYTLIIKPDFICKHLSEKFEVIDCRGLPKNPWTDMQSGQFYVTFKRK